MRLCGVSFSYDGDRPALDGIELTIMPGERVAVVGSSGAGKTTLAGVVAGIHEPHTGMVAAPHRTAVINQEAHVFAGTLRDNLTLAAPRVTDDEVHSALEATGAAGLARMLPQGLETPLGTIGHELTAAQTQQIALARVVLADPDLAILDEATAEAGSTHAGLLDRAADAALRDRTGLVIAHRLSQAMTCDRILVMDRGRIIEDGTHAALIGAGGAYARLWASSF
ncbi:MAG TPA: ABC transporter ATP-binding protein [Nakamurella sp.]